MPLLSFTSTRKNSSRVPKIPHPEEFFTMPNEDFPHEGTWLQWPHDFGWDSRHVYRYEDSWVAMAKALHTGERVHIVVYNDKEEERVKNLLQREGLDMSKIDFFPWFTDDVWVRDNGPIFVFDESDGALCVANWVFNGWGGKADCDFDNYIPIRVGHALDLPVIDIPMVHEGGSVEVDGKGTMMAKKSSILNSNRNKGYTQEDAERFYKQYLGVTNFIWLDGKVGSEDITDDHIDGTARFANGDTIVTFHKDDFQNPREYKILKKAVNAKGEHYKIVHLPLTKHKLTALDDYGFYMNYYVGNEVVLVPSFDDPNDSVAAEELQNIYPTRKVISIPFTEVYRDGGMIHCVTQQQPMQNKR